MAIRDVKLGPKSPLAEGRVVKGGQNLKYQITDRPPDPPPMRPERPCTVDTFGRKHPPDPAHTTTQQATAEANARGVGFKADGDKPRWDLLPWGPVEDVVEVLTFGAREYAPDNWQKVENPRRRYFAAAVRHIAAWWRGERLDPKSGKPHLAHAGCCLLFLAWFDREEKPR